MSSTLLTLVTDSTETMAPATRKRKANTAADANSTAATKKQKKAIEPTASSSRPSRSSLAEAAAPRSTRSSVSGKSAPDKSTQKAAQAPVSGTAKKPATKTATKAKATDGGKRGKSAKTATKEEEVAVPRGTSAVLVDVPFKQKLGVDAGAEEEGEVNDEGQAYWLMKAEPESRIEKGKDIKFSIDDLKAANEPEGWDGMSWC